MRHGELVFAGREVAEYEVALRVCDARTAGICHLAAGDVC